MELLFVDPFESLQTYSGALPTEAVRMIGASPYASGGTGNARITTQPGILSDIHLLRSSTGTHSIGFDLGSVQTTGKFVYGLAFRPTLGGSNQTNIVSFYSDSGSIFHAMMAPNGAVAFLGGEELSGMTSLDYGYFEFVIDLDEGEFEVYLNNVLLFGGSHSLSGVSHRFLFKLLSSPGQAFPSWTDDIYMLGGTTGPFADRLGPVRAIRAPLIDTAEANFLPQGTASNLAAVNKTNLAEGTYNRSPASNNVGDRFLIDSTVVPEGKDVLAVSQLLYYRKSDIGPRNLDSVITGPSGANKVSKQMPENLVAFGGAEPQIITQAPGGGALTIETLEDMEFGYEVKA